MISPLNSLLFSLTVLLFNTLSTTTEAFTNFAGTCDEGNFGLGDFHEGTRQTLNQRSIVLKIDGVAVAPDTVIELKQGSHDLTVTSTNGSTKFKGHLIRLKGENDIDTGNMLFHTNSDSRVNPLCPPWISAIEHTSNKNKSSVTATFLSREMGDYVLDLHVVVSDIADWTYDQYLIKVIMADAPTVSPSPTIIRTESNTKFIWGNKNGLALVVLSGTIAAYFVISLIVLPFVRPKRLKRKRLQKALPQKQEGQEEFNINPTYP